MQPWFRFYHEALTDRKIGEVCRLTGQSVAIVLGVWTTILCLANDSPERGSLLIADGCPVTTEYINGITGLGKDTFEAILEQFKALCMVVQDDGVYHVANWDKRQFSSDNSLKRVRNYRIKRNDLGLTQSIPYDSSELIYRDNGQCVYCGSVENLCIDHAFPIDQGGTDDSDNLVCACKRCNSGKAGRTPEQAGYKFLDKKAERRYKKYVTSRNGYSNEQNQNQSQNRTELQSATKTVAQSKKTCPKAWQLALHELVGTPVEQASPGMRKRISECGIVLSKDNSPESLQAFKSWWYEMDWRGKQGQPPTPEQIRDNWSKAINGNGNKVSAPTKVYR